MSRYKCIISYDGSGFCGYQIQPKDRTVQGELEKALRRIHKQERYFGGRFRKDRCRCSCIWPSDPF